MLIVEMLGGWFVASLVTGFLFGRFISARDRHPIA